MIGQSRLSSAIEGVLNVGSGFILAMILWQFIVAPLYGYKVTIMDNAGLTAIFTGVSLVRGYFWRRIFEHRIHRKIQKYEKGEYVA